MSTSSSPIYTLPTEIVDKVTCFVAGEQVDQFFTGQTTRKMLTSFKEMRRDLLSLSRVGELGGVPEELGAAVKLIGGDERLTNVKGIVISGFSTYSQLFTKTDLKKISKILPRLMNLTHLWFDGDDIGWLQLDPFTVKSKKLTFLSLNLGVCAEAYEPGDPAVAESWNNGGYPRIYIVETPRAINLIDLSLTRDTEFCFHVESCFYSIMPNLERLSLDACGFDEVSPCLHQFPKLRELSVGSYNVDDDMFSILPNSLRVLDTVISSITIQLKNLGKKPFYLREITIDCSSRGYGSDLTEFAFSITSHLPPSLKVLSLQEVNLESLSSALEAATCGELEILRLKVFTEYSRKGREAEWTRLFEACGRHGIELERVQERQY